VGVIFFGFASQTLDAYAPVIGVAVEERVMLICWREGPDRRDGVVVVSYPRHENEMAASEPPPNRLSIAQVANVATLRTAVDPKAEIGGFRQALVDLTMW